MDNTQFRFGQALRPVGNVFGNLLDSFKKTYLTRVYGFRLDSICVMTLLFEGLIDFIIFIFLSQININKIIFTCVSIDLGKKSEVVAHKNCIAKIALSFGGVTAGERNGERGYMLTFVIAYIRVRNIVLF